MEIKRVIADRGILGVVGAYNSAVSNVIGEATAASKLTVISPASSNDALTTQGWLHFNRLVPPDRSHAVAALNYMTAELKVKTAFVVSDNTGYGNGLTKTIMAEMKKRGVEVVEYVGVSTDEEAAATVKKIKAAGMDLVYCGCYENVLAPVLKGMRAEGIKASFMGAGTLDSPSFVKRVGVDAEGAVFTTGFGPITSFTSAAGFIEKYKAAYGAVPSGMAGYAYDAATTLLMGIRTAGGKNVPTRIAVAAAVRKTNLPACFSGTANNCTTVSGAIGFANDGDRDRSRLLVMKFSPLLQAQIEKSYTINAK
ncbi:branched-chain amino acid ABC transporter substrate-binding protein [Deinococcus malanensis]|uniref:branched-chain amino acid ABC transporter substrate-binding protein n=1 Tax=Deinococcus malanensis TaxID=1706855 RepID=UPI00363CF1BA